MLHSKTSFLSIVQIQTHTSQYLLYVSLHYFKDDSNLANALKITRTHLNVGYLKNNDTIYNPQSQIKSS